MLKRGLCVLMRVYSRSSASASELVTVTSILAIWWTTAWILGATLLGLKYVVPRSFRLFALPTYNNSPSASNIRYTPGRFGSDAVNSLWSNAWSLISRKKIGRRLQSRQLHCPGHHLLEHRHSQNLGGGVVTAA